MRFWKRRQVENQGFWGNKAWAAPWQRSALGAGEARKQLGVPGLSKAQGAGTLSEARSTSRPANSMGLASPLKDPRWSIHPGLSRSGSGEGAAWAHRATASSTHQANGVDRAHGSLDNQHTTQHRWKGMRCKGGEWRGWRAGNGSPKEAAPQLPVEQASLWTSSGSGSVLAGRAMSQDRGTDILGRPRERSRQGDQSGEKPAHAQESREASSPGRSGARRPAHKAEGNRAAGGRASRAPSTEGRAQSSPVTSLRVTPRG